MRRRLAEGMVVLAGVVLAGSVWAQDPNAPGAAEPVGSAASQAAEAGSQAATGGETPAVQTLHLRRDGTWAQLGSDALSRFLLRVSDVKQAIFEGKVAEAQAALTALKQEFPGIVGPDLDAFMAAEAIYARGQWVEAVRAYDTFMDSWPESRFYESALEREFSIATAFLKGEKRRVLKVLKLSGYEEGAKIMQRIADRAGDAPIAKRALLALARSYEERGEYLDAYETWADIANRWPTGPTGQTALVEMAQSLHSAYKGPLYDPTSLISARTYYKNYQLRYPQDAEAREIEGKIALIREQLAYKQYSTGVYYERVDHPEAARYYYELVRDNWPGTNAARMAEAKLGGPGSPGYAALQEKTTVARRAFDVTTRFLDTWFGLARFFGGEGTAGAVEPTEAPAGLSAAEAAAGNVEAAGTPEKSGPGR